MGLVGAAVGIGDALSELVDGEEAVGFHDTAFAMDPGRFDGVEPGALDRQVAGDDADAVAALLGLSVVATDPGADLLADVPGGIVPDEEQGLLAVGVELSAAPVQVIDG